jgi:hypothetical protein
MEITAIGRWLARRPVIGTLKCRSSRCSAMQQSTSTLMSIAGAIALLAVAVTIVVAELRARRSRRNSLDEPLEMSTLTFPPGSLDPRPRRQRKPAHGGA